MFNRHSTFTCLLCVLTAAFVPPNAWGQNRPVLCPDGIHLAQLPGVFSGAIEFEGYRFRVPDWTKEVDVSGNSAYYVPADPTNLDPVDVTTTKRWANATLLLACYEGMTPFGPYLQVMVLRKIGTLQDASALCDDPTQLTELADAGAAGTPGGCGGGNGNSEIPSNCAQQYVRVEIYNDQTGIWELYWEGYALVCG